jgi:menaquinone-dependent protoporphyrinogen oxidase
VTAASRHGSTAEIAHAIADELTADGFDVTVLAPDLVTSARDYDAVVLGSGVYAGHWLPSATELLERHAQELAQRPVWLFSSGPLGDPPKPTEDPIDVARIRARIGARGHRVFPGKIAKDELGFAERAIVRIVRAPEGDYRPWDEVRGWAQSIAGWLQMTAPPAPRLTRVQPGRLT